MEQTNLKKKSGIFFAVALLVEYLVRFIADEVLMSTMTPSENFDYKAYNLTSQIVSFGISVFSILLFFALGYILTKSKKGTLIFAGSIYLAKTGIGLIKDIIEAVLYALNITGVMYTNHTSIVSTIISTATLPFIILLARYVYTAFNGLNSKVPGSLKTSELTLSSARKRFLVAYIITTVLTAVITSASAFIYTLIGSDNGTVFAIIGQFITCTSGILTFAIIYYAGYKAWHDPIDGMSFLAVHGVSAAISGAFLSLLLIPAIYGIQAAEAAEDYKKALLFSNLASAASVIALIIEIALFMYVLKAFFAPYKATLFDDPDFDRSKFKYLIATENGLALSEDGITPIPEDSEEEKNVSPEEESEATPDEE